MVIYLRGEDTYRVDEALRSYVQAYQRKHDPKGVSVARLDGETLDPQALQRAVATPGLLTARQLVVLRRLASRKKIDAADTLATLLSDHRIPPEVVVIVVEHGVPETAKRTHPVFVALAALPPRRPKARDEDFQERFDALVGRALEQWVEEAARQRGTRLAPAARALVLGLTSGDLRRVTTELDKLAAYRPDQLVTPEDVRLFVHANFEPNIFDLTDALGARDLARALGLLEQQLNSGAHPLYLLTMMMRHLRILREVQAVGGGHPATLAWALKLHPFVVTKALSQVGAFSTADLVKLFEAAVALEERIKTGAPDPATELTLLIAEACGGMGHGGRGRMAAR